MIQFFHKWSSLHRSAFPLNIHWFCIDLWYISIDTPHLVAIELKHWTGSSYLCIRLFYSAVLGPLNVMVLVYRSLNGSLVSLNLPMNVIYPWISFTIFNPLNFTSGMCLLPTRSMFNFKPLEFDNLNFLLLLIAVTDIFSNRNPHYLKISFHQQEPCSDARSQIAVVETSDFD